MVLRGSDKASAGQWPIIMSSLHLFSRLLRLCPDAQGQQIRGQIIRLIRDNSILCSHARIHRHFCQFNVLSTEAY